MKLSRKNQRFMTASSARTEPAPLDRGAHREPALVVGEVELAVHRLAAVAHDALAFHRQRAGARDVEAEGAAVVVAVAELAGAARAEHAARVARGRFAQAAGLHRAHRRLLAAHR